MKALNLMYGLGVVPRSMQTGETAQLDKYNGKEGTLSIRLINKLDPIGKAMVNYIYDQGQNLYHDFEYGFCKHRRREQPILIQQVTSWKLRQAASSSKLQWKPRYSHIVTMRDISNAFPSIGFEALDTAVDSTHQGSDAQFLKQRYRDTHMIV